MHMDIYELIIQLYRLVSPSRYRLNVMLIVSIILLLLLVVVVAIAIAIAVDDDGKSVYLFSPFGLMVLITMTMIKLMTLECILTTMTKNGN